MFEALEGSLARDEMLAWRGQFADFTIHVMAGDAKAWTVALRDGAAEVLEGVRGEPTLTFAAAPEIWERFAEPVPPVGFQALESLWETGRMELRGDALEFQRNLFFLEDLFARVRGAPDRAEPAPWAAPAVEPVTGRYLRVNIDGRPHRVYFEEAGEGIPLLCLHTAGADARQYRAVLNDPEVTKHFRVIAFDLPWHGKASPPPGFERELYMLTTDRYVETVMAVKEGLGLENPVVMGCSIGGRAVLHLALRHGDAFRAGVGLQSAIHAESAWSEDQQALNTLYRADAHGPEAGAAACASLISPSAPSEHRWETLWHYMNGGPGVFMGDLYYYFVDGDMRNGIAEGIDTDRCPLFLLTGEYDWSASPEMTQELAKLVKAQHCEIMKGVGHFPMSENPEAFLGYLRPVLDKVRAL